jgi:hypothetical protein
MKHTPGKWEIDGYETTAVIALKGGKWRCVAKCGLHNGMTPLDLNEQKANARLIASAPELLEACKLALGEFKEMGYEPPRYKIELLEQAIAKAEDK